MLDGITPDLAYIGVGLVSLAAAVNRLTKVLQKKRITADCENGTDCFTAEDKATAERTDKNVTKLCIKHSIEPIA